MREYSIPHLRRSGRISIPEDSFDRIREARDLHKEGLGTDSVRRQLREGRGPDTGELDRRLNNLHETLKGLRAELRERPATDEVAVSPTLRTILARQSLLISAMFNLTGMVEDLLLASGKRRRARSEHLGVGLTEPFTDGEAAERFAIPATLPATAPIAPSADAEGRSTPPRSTGFGALGRRRRRGVLAIASVLLVALCLAWAVPALTGSGDDAASETARVSGGAPTNRASGSEGRGAMPGEATSPDETTTQTSQPETGAGTATAPSEPGGKISVPDVSGRSIAEAAQALSDAGLEVSFIRDEESFERPEAVMGTIPAAGTEAEPGTPITLRVSVGPDAAPTSTPNASASASTGGSASPASSASVGASSSASVGSASAGASSSAAGYAN